MASKRLLVDVHTHVYLPRYASFLRTRTCAPKIFKRNEQEGERLLILDDEPSGGRPIGPQYWDRDEKLKFMDKHGIDVSVVSSANPWLDFVPAPTARTLAHELNEDLETYCSTAPAKGTMERLYGFGLLPLVPGIPVSALLETVQQITTLKHIRGIIIGTRGIGKGLDDERLDPVWEALEKAGLVVFLHPHYGIDTKEWGKKENGHVLSLALGFPFETATATTRLILAGVLDRYPNLRLLLAHSGGALPQISSRLASCIAHDPIVSTRLAHDARFYLGKLYYDAVAYGPEELGFLSDVIARADKFAEPASHHLPPEELKGDAQRRAGSQRMLFGTMLFGTDHPFFPPLEKVDKRPDESDKWLSVMQNLDAIERVWGWGEEEKEAVKGGNAVKLFGL